MKRSNLRDAISAGMNPRITRPDIDRTDQVEIQVRAFLQKSFDDVMGQMKTSADASALKCLYNAILVQETPK